MEIIDSITGFFAVVGGFAAVVLSLYFYFRARNKERMAMIEKGMVFKNPSKPARPIRSLKTGMFFIGIALGIFLGHLVGSSSRINEVVSFFVMILLFGGIALSLNYVLELKLNKREE